MVAVAVEALGVSETIQAMESAKDRLADVSPALNITADLLERHTALQFATEGRRGGTPWAPLATGTARARRKRWGHYAQPPAAGVRAEGPVLQWTARLRRSHARGHGEHVRTVGPSSLEWGTDVPYAIFHQRRRPAIAFASDFQRREILVRPVELWLQGVPAGAIEQVMLARTQL